MKTFRDTAGREWAITVDVNAIKRVLKAPIEHLGEPLKVNLLALVDPDSDLLKKVVEYPPLVCDIAYALCKPQCDEKSVSDEDFGRAMGGDVLEKVLDLHPGGNRRFFPPGSADGAQEGAGEEPDVRREGEGTDDGPAGGGGTGRGDRRGAGAGTQEAPRARKKHPRRLVLVLLRACRHRRHRPRTQNARRTDGDGQGPPAGRVGADVAAGGDRAPTLIRDAKKRKKPFQPWEFNPFAERTAAEGRESRRSRSASSA